MSKKLLASVLLFGIVLGIPGFSSAASSLKTEFPDLIVTDVSFEKNILSVTEDVFADVTIKNIGKTPVDALETPFLITLSDQKQWGDRVTFGKEFPTEGDSILDPQEESTVTLRLPYKQRQFKLWNNPHVFTATVDRENVIKEMNELNNTYAKSVRFKNDPIVVTDSFFLSNETTTYSETPTYLTWTDPKNLEYSDYVIRYAYFDSENCNGEDSCIPPAFDNALYSQTNDAGLTYMVGYLANSDINMVRDWKTLEFNEESFNNQAHTVSSALSKPGRYYFVVEYEKNILNLNNNQYFYSNVLTFGITYSQLFVSLNENNPRSSVFPKGAQRVELMNIDFETSQNTSDIEITEIEFGHDGRDAQLSDFTDFYLVRNNEIVSSHLTVDPTRNIVRFSDLSFIVPSGTIQSLSLKADISMEANTGAQHYFDISTEHDITASDETDIQFLDVIRSSYFEISTAHVGSLSIASSGSISNHSPDEKDTQIAEFSLSADPTEDVSLERISLKALVLR